MELIRDKNGRFSKGSKPWTTGNKLSKEHKEKLLLSHLGVKLTKEQKIRRSENSPIKEDKCYMWKGDNVSYRGIHKWIEKKVGKPHFCEECKKTNLNHRQYHWANISGKYFRDVRDWRRLCVKCHKLFDKLKKYE